MPCGIYFSYIYNVIILFGAQHEAALVCLDQCRFYIEETPFGLNLKKYESKLQNFIG